MPQTPIPDPPGPAEVRRPAHGVTAALPAAARVRDYWASRHLARAPSTTAKTIDAQERDRHGGPA